MKEIEQVKNAAVSVMQEIIKDLSNRKTLINSADYFILTNKDKLLARINKKQEEMYPLRGSKKVPPRKGSDINLDRELESLLVVHSLLVEGAFVTNYRIDDLINKTTKNYTFEYKQKWNLLKEGHDKCNDALEFFEKEYVPALVTSDGKTDTVSVYDDLQHDGISIAKLVCHILNTDEPTLQEILQFAKDHKKGNFISEEVIDSFKMN